MIDSKLNTLLAVYEHNSFTRAAKSLNLTQPAVSQQILKLEEIYGCRIFERTKPDLMLTKEGEQIIRTAYKLRSIEEELKRSLRGQKGDGTVLLVGMTHLPDSDPFTALLASLAPERGISFRIVTESEEYLQQMLDQGKLDFYVSEGPPPSDRYSTVPLERDELILIVPPDNPLAVKRSVGIDRVQKEKLILRGDDLTGNSLFAAALGKNGLSLESFQVIMEIDSIKAVKDLVARGFGVSVLPRSTCLDELKQKKIYSLRIRNLVTERERVLVFRRDYGNEGLLQDIVNSYRRIS